MGQPEPQLYLIMDSRDQRVNVENSMKALIMNDKLHQWRSFKRLNVKIESSYDVEHLMSPFADILISKLRDLEGLKLTFSSFYSINGKVLEEFIQIVTKYMAHLTEFELIFKYQKQVNNENVKFIVRQIIRNLPYLELLTIRFDGCPQVTKESFDAFGYYTRRNLTRVKKLNLSFGQNNIPHFKFNFDTLFPSLESLHLNLSYCSNTNDKDLNIFASNVLTKLHSIKEMILQLCCFWSITDEGMLAFSSCISQNPTLQRLKIDFYGWRAITDKGLSYFAQEVCSKNKNLRDFTVLFADCYLLTDSGIISLLNQIGTHLPHLEKLQLDFSRSPHNKIEVTDASLKELGATISKHGKNLKCLALSFSGCIKVTNQGLEALISPIEKIAKNLKSVKLHFRRCPSIPEDYVWQINQRFGAYTNVDFKLDWSFELNG